MKRGFSQSHSFDEMADILDIEHPHALGLFVRLLAWAAEARPLGDVGQASNKTLGVKCGWTGSADEMIDAMLRVGLLANHTVHRLIIVDWPDHCDDGVHTYVARRRLLFANGSKPRMKGLHSDERDTANKEYVAILANAPDPRNFLGTQVEIPPPFHGVSDRNGAERNVLDRSGTPISAKPKAKPPQTATRLLSEKVWKECIWKKVKKAEGLKAIDKAIAIIADRDSIAVDAAAKWLADKAAAYAASPIGTRPDKEFRPHPATWFNAAQYDDDPDEWRHKPTGPITAKAQARAERDAREPAQEIDFEVMRIGNQ